MHSMFDASKPPLTTPSGYQAVAGYLGDPANTPHVWTQDEWNRYRRKRWLPIWVYDPGKDPAAQAGDCLLQLFNLGIPSHVTRWGITWRNVVALDLETLKALRA